MDRKQFEARIIAKAWQDAEFRQALESDPKGTLSRELEVFQPGAKLPENLKVTVLEETPEQLYLVIPNNPTAASGALDDASLEAVAGGAAPPANVAAMLDVVSLTQVVSQVVTQVSTLDVVTQVGVVVAASGT